MLKQWFSKNMECYYVVLPDGSNRVLTSDGVLMDYPESKNIDKEQYAQLKKQLKYDYNRTMESGKLTKKPIEEKPTVKQVAGEIPVTSTATVSVEPTESETTEKEPVQMQKPKRQKKDIINAIERVIMLCVSMLTIALSIYYTRDYLMNTNSEIIATALSVSMLLYSLVGLQVITSLRKHDKKFKAFLFAVTSLMTIVFSMFTSLDVNITRYLENTKVVQTETVRTEANSLILESIKQQKEQNRNTVEMLTKDIEYYQTRNLNTYTQREQIKVLDEEYAELTKKEIELINSDTQVAVQDKDSAHKISSLVDVLSKVVGVDADILQMLIMCFASIFIDIIAPLALNVAIFGKKEISLVDETN